MDLLDDILRNEVYPAVGCTEPIACAYAAAVAADALGKPVETLALRVDRGTFKNGAAVVVPNSGGRKGNAVAGAIGALAASPGQKLELMNTVTAETLDAAVAMLREHRVAYSCMDEASDFRIKATVCGAGHEAACVLSDGHVNIEQITVDGEATHQRERQEASNGPGYRDALRELTIGELVARVNHPTDSQRDYLQRGVEMNLLMAEHGYDVRGAASQLKHMRDSGILQEDLFYRVKTRVAGAVDARMAGVARPVMTSGGSGNQGIVAILTPYLVGRDRDVPHARILESLAVAHALNAYIKCFVGELSVICGCAMSAGIAAATAIVYQVMGSDAEHVTFAVNNVVADLSGLICDGAKPGCAMKTVSAVDAALRAAFMALRGFGPSCADGVVGRSPEESIRNLGRVTLEGMLPMDPTLVDILAGKSVAGSA